MERDAVKLFLGLQDFENTVADNRVWLVLHVLFTLVFLDLPCMLYLWTNTAPVYLSIVPGLYTVGIFPLLIWFKKICKQKTMRNPFSFECVIFLLETGLFSYLALMVAYTKTGFREIFVTAFLIGTVFCVAMCVCRNCKWKRIKTHRHLNSDSVATFKWMIPAMVIITFASKRYIKTLSEEVIYIILGCGLIVLSFVFLAVAIIMICNMYIYKKHVCE